MTTLGIFLIIGSVILLILLPSLKKRKTLDEQSTKNLSFFSLVRNQFAKLTNKIVFAFMIVGVILVFIPYLFFWAQPGYQYFLVYPTGKKSAVMNEGIKWRGFAQVVPWQKFIDVKVIDEDSDMKDVGDIEGAMRPIPIRFIDQVTGFVKVSTRFQLPRDPDRFIELAVEFRTLDNLVQTTLIPTVKETMSNTGYMFAAQDYISGSAQQFRTTFEQQLTNGSYAVNKKAIYDTVFEKIDVPGMAREIKTIKTNYQVEKILGPDGQPKVIPNEITKTGILVAQVLVDMVMLETTFKKRLEAQRDESAKRQLEQQKIKTAKDAQARIIAEGERDKAAERVTQEKEQVKALIAIETKLKQEETNKKLAEIALQTQRLTSEAEKVKADAESYKNQKLVKAGLTPQERATIDKETAIGVARELAKINFPQTMIIGGSDKGGTPLESLIGAAMAKQLTTNK